MAPKKKQCNGFYMFMKDFKSREEARGREFKNMDEASAAAGAEWVNMGPDDRAPYDSKAKELKNRVKGVKYTSTGIKVEVYEQREQELLNKRKNMESYIENLVSDGKDYTTKDFLVAYVNYYCFNSSNNSYIPAEISIVHFNLQNGVDLADKFHVILGPAIPMGYRHAAENHSGESHGLPIPPHEDAIAQLSETDFCGVLERIIEYLSKFADNKMPPLYVQDNNMEQAKSGFQYLLNVAGYDEDYFTIYSLSYLFYILRNAALATRISGNPIVEPVTSDLASVNGNTDTQAISIHILQKEMERDIYSYTMDIACEYHNDTDQFCFCSLSYAIRNIFTICDHTCSDLGIEFIPGCHVPANAILEAKSHRSHRAPVMPAAVPMNRRASNTSQGSRCSPALSEASGVTRRSTKTESVASAMENKWRPMRLPTTPSIAGSFNLDFPALGERSSSSRGRGRGTYRCADEGTPGMSSTDAHVGRTANPASYANKMAAGIKRDASNPWNIASDGISASTVLVARGASSTGATSKGRVRPAFEQSLDAATEDTQNPQPGGSNGTTRGRGRGRIIRDDVN